MAPFVFTYSFKIITLAYGLISGAFTLFFGGGIIESICSVIIGFALSFIVKCYDAMYQGDKLQLFSGNSVAESMNGNEEIKSEGWDAGKTIAAAFEPQWKHEQYSLYYFESQDWYTALEKAEAFDWKGAMDIWIGLLKTRDLMKRSCAEYNIAVACYMLGDYGLASDWLDLSDADNLLPFSDALRKRIASRQ